MAETIGLEDLFKMWEKDCVIDEFQLDKAALLIAKLHGKWAPILSRHNLKVRKLEEEYRKLRQTKKLYYQGKLTKAELTEFGWDQFDLRLLKDEVAEYLENDKDLVSIGTRKFYNQEIVDFCREAIKQLNNRGFQIRAAIDFAKFISGGK